jgi:hypothetical protein
MHTHLSVASQQPGMEDALRDCYIMRLLLAYRITESAKIFFRQLICLVPRGVPLTLTLKNCCKISHKNGLLNFDEVFARRYMKLIFK